MTHLKRILVTAAITLSTQLLGAQTGFAANQIAPARASAGGVEFKLDYDPQRAVYSIYFRPTASATAPHLTLSSQVTIKVPHGVGAGKFTPSAIESPTAGTAWTLTSRVNGPSEDTAADYLSFELSYPAGDYNAFVWQAGQAIKVFSFKNTATCAGVVGIIAANDPFIPKPKNSVGSNPGNQITVLGLGPENSYMGNYGAVAVDCAGTEVAFPAPVVAATAAPQPTATASVPTATVLPLTATAVPATVVPAATVVATAAAAATSTVVVPPVGPVSYGAATTPKVFVGMMLNRNHRVYDYMDVCVRKQFA